MYTMDPNSTESTSSDTSIEVDENVVTPFPKAKSLLSDYVVVYANDGDDEANDGDEEDNDDDDSDKVEETQPGQR